MTKLTTNDLFRFSHLERRLFVASPEQIGVDPLHCVSIAVMKANSDFVAGWNVPWPNQAKEQSNRLKK
jgi:hypothetical protein